MPATLCPLLAARCLLLDICCCSLFACCLPRSFLLCFAGRPAEVDGGELWSAVSTSAFAARLDDGHVEPGDAERCGFLVSVVPHSKLITVYCPTGDSERGGGAATVAGQLMAAEIAALLAPYFGGAPPQLLGSSAKRWRAGFAAGSLDHAHECVSLPAWQLAVAGDFVAEHASPAKAAALSGLAAGEAAATF